MKIQPLTMEETADLEGLHKTILRLEQGVQIAKGNVAAAEAKVVTAEKALTTYMTTLAQRYGIQDPANLDDTQTYIYGNPAT